MQPSLPTLDVLGVPVLQATSDEALSAVVQAADSDPPALVAYVNAHTLNLAAADPEYRKLLRAAALVLNDGAGLALAGRIFGAPFPENLNGSDFNPRIVQAAADNGWSVYFLGATPGVAEEAARRLSARFPALQVAGARDGYFERSSDGEVARAIAASRAEVLLVALGNPLQEQWLARWLPDTGCRLGVGVGAFFDFTAQRVARAPAWMNRLGIEWVWRLALEPRRLWRRYVVGNPLFLWRVLRARISR